MLAQVLELAGLAILASTTALPDSKRAIGTLNGEQET